MNFKKTYVAIAMLNMAALEEIQAATFRVDSTVDQTSVCTFEAALAKINGVANPGLANCNSINSNPLGTNDEILFRVNQISNISSALRISKSVKINPGGSRVRFIGTKEDRIFDIRPNSESMDVSFDNVHISGGNTESGLGGGISISEDTIEMGSATKVLEVTFELNNSEVVDNSAAEGGGVASLGAQVEIKNSSIANNTATSSPFLGSGGIYAAGGVTHSGNSGNASLLIQDSSIDANTATRGRAGGIGVESSKLTIRNSSVSGNNGAGIFIVDDEFNLNNVNISNNSSISTNTSGNGLISVRSVGSISNSIIENNASVTRGGGINLSQGCNVDTCVIISNTKVVGNTSENEGGGVFVGSGATLKINSSTLSNNQTTRHGGGIFVNRSGKVDLLATTVSDNQSTNGGGGGIAQAGESEVFVVNSTIANNIAGSAGGGFYRFGLSGSNPKLHLLHTTIRANKSIRGNTGAGINFDSGTVILSNSIVAGNITSSLDSAQEIFVSSLTSEGVNLLGNSRNTLATTLSGFTPSSNDITATSDGSNPSSLSEIFADANLTNNGGATLTYSLANNSPALSSADSSECIRAGSVDQVGTQRLAAACDIGAFETPDSVNFYTIRLANGKVAVVSL